MADKKISALPAATTPLAGTEVLPIVQGGVTDKVSVANLTAGRVVAASGASLTVGSGTARLEMISPDNGGSNFYVDVSGTGAAFNMVNGFPISFKTANTEAFRVDTNQNIVISTAGKGIDFSANTGLPGATSELLDWYEEGTWAIADTSGAGLTLTVDHAKYTRVGNLVTVNAYVTYPVTADASANQLSLPYTAAKYDIGTAGASTGNVYSAITIGGGAQMSVRNLSLQPLLNSNLSGADVLINFTYMV